jgi:hypothetical protein
MEGWRKLRNEELHNLYDSRNIIRVIKLRSRWAGHVACIVRVRACVRNAYKALVWKFGGKRPFGRHMRKWKYNIKRDLRKQREKM